MNLGTLLNLVAEGETVLIVTNINGVAFSTLPISIKQAKEITDLYKKEVLYFYVNDSSELVIILK